MATKRVPAASSPVSIKLDADERSRLSALAAARQRSSHYLMREAVREYLTREELRQAFADEAETAWLDYERTGLHVTHAEIDAWAKSLVAKPLGAKALGTRRPKRFPKWHK
jgi:predicted transcriptional regulator